jgi:hypothetical protein
VQAHDRSKGEKGQAPASREVAAPTPAAALQLQRTVGNRATTRILSRMEATEASDQIRKSLAALGPDTQTIGRTLSAFKYDIEGFDKVASEYKKAGEAAGEKPPHTMMQDLPQTNQAAAPAGWYEGIMEPPA